MKTTHDFDDLNNQDYDHNIALIYDYVEKSIDILRSNLSEVTNNLRLLAAAEVTYIHFFLSDLPSPSFADMITENIELLPCYSCFIFKTLAYILSITSITICLWKGYSKESIRLVIKPNNLLSQAEKGTITQYKQSIIINIWKYTIEDLNKFLQIRAKALRQAVITLILSMVCAVLDTIIHFVFYP